MSDISFIGLGEMGSALAGRLLETGHSVRVWNRSPGAADALVASGATRAASIADALSVGTVISMLANDAAAESVFSAESLAPTLGLDRGRRFSRHSIRRCKAAGL